MKENLEKALKKQGYEAPMAEVIEIESQGMFCASLDGDITGTAFYFGTSGGSWGGSEGSGFQFGTSGGSW